MPDTHPSNGEPASEAIATDLDGLEDPRDLFEGETTRDRVLDVVLQLREPTTVATVAERAVCDDATARTYLEWFHDLGIVDEYDGRPVRYARSEWYLHWRRAKRLRERLSDAELHTALRRVVREIEAFREEFDANAPSEVSLRSLSETMSVEDAWRALTRWETLERQADILEQARRADRTVPPTNA